VPGMVQPCLRGMVCNLDAILQSSCFPPPALLALHEFCVELDFSTEGCSVRQTGLC